MSGLALMSPLFYGAVIGTIKPMLYLYCSFALGIKWTSPSGEVLRPYEL